METEKYPVARLPPIGSLQAQNMSPRTEAKYEGLSGPSYTLGGRSSKYTLPPPRTLKPYQDTKAGGLETWPAHASGYVSSAPSAALNREKQLVLVDDEACGKPQMIPKPKFLDQLEEFLKKELKSLGVSEAGPSDLRLQAHREVFEYLIEDFKTYRPLLSAIKNEYEMMLVYQRDQMRQMEPLKQMLVTVSEQCDQKIMALRDQEKQEMMDLKNENRRLYQRIDDLRNEQLALESQVEKLQEELAAEYLRYRDECDSKKLLISDINDLRYQQEDLLMSKQSMEELDGEDRDDPVTLKIALKKCREDEAAATKRLTEMEANYGDVIPRRDYEHLEKQNQVLLEKMEDMKNDFVKLQDEHNALLDVHKQVLQQRDEFYVERETLKRTSTPRPDWEKCADYVTGGVVRWKELAEGKTSDQLVDVLLEEISGSSGADVGGADYFDGQGLGDDIPRYMRYEGKVRNRRLGKRDCALLVRDIWREKAAHDAERRDGVRENLADFLHMYLQRRFGLEQMVVEWGYNLHDACERYSHDERIGLFWRIITGKADEQLYHLQLQMIAKMLNQLTKLDVDKGNQGTLSKEEFQTVLQEFFQYRDEYSIAKLVKTAVEELEAQEEETLDYKNLFMEDDEGKTGQFLDEVKHQFEQERLQYVKEIKDQLPKEEPVTVDDLKMAITITDPVIEQDDLNRYIAWAFKVSSANMLDGTESQTLESIVQRLQNGNLKRIGKRI